MDVPEELYDPTFPVDDFTYGTLHINSGRQTMDGHTALNYARSRHSTSDFDRSARQQIIIKSVLQKLLSFGSLSKIKKLYSNVSSTVTTNIGINDILKYI
ncbi:LCP family protein [Patescibacteria group bacterium]|nr:LCP family protein [Patescibacteria group bacterium]